MARMNLVRWWRSLALPWRRWRVVAHVTAGDEIPDRIPRRGVVLVGHATHATWAAFDCPCGRGHRLMLNLDSARSPRWRIVSLRPLSIRPSVDDVTSERRCHFVVRQGRIAWAPERPGDSND